MTDNVQKKLAAVMFTYLVEYDDYLKKDEDHAIKVLNEHKKIEYQFTGRQFMGSRCRPRYVVGAVYTIP